jgi:hypothetical protein
MRRKLARVECRVGKKGRRGVKWIGIREGLGLAVGTKLCTSVLEVTTEARVFVGDFVGREPFVR